jgi:hypothetical protein
LFRRPNSILVASPSAQSRALLPNWAQSPESKRYAGPQPASRKPSRVSDRPDQLILKIKMRAPLGYSKFAENHTL